MKGGWLKNSRQFLPWDVLNCVLVRRSIHLRERWGISSIVVCDQLDRARGRVCCTSVVAKLETIETILLPLLRNIGKPGKGRCETGIESELKGNRKGTRAHDGANELAMNNAARISIRCNTRGPSSLGRRVSDRTPDRGARTAMK
jgi:hypothetical protein